MAIKTTATRSQRSQESIDEIDSEICSYLASHGKTKAAELAELVGITVPSIRYRILKLIAKGIVGQQKSRDRQVWWFLLKKQAAKFEKTCESSSAGGSDQPPY